MEQFPRFDALDAGCGTELAAARHVHLSPGDVLFRPGTLCRGFPMVLGGTVRVRLLSPGGREVVLYELGAGDVCVLSTACLLSGDAYPAEGLAASALELRVLDSSAFERLLSADASFRTMVFTGFGARLATMMARIEDVAFRSVTARLAYRLLELGAVGHVAATHEMLAADLGTAREVVGRTLHKMAQSGWVDSKRGRITLLQPEVLKVLADGDEVTDASGSLR